MPQLARSAPPHLHPLVDRLWASAPEGRPAERAGARETCAADGWPDRLTPKAYARLLRVDRVLVLALAMADSTCGWADIAQAAGYSDPPHLGREFSALAGLPPQAWHRAASLNAPRHVPV